VSGFPKNVFFAAVRVPRKNRRKRYFSENRSSILWSRRSYIL